MRFTQAQYDSYLARAMTGKRQDACTFADAQAVGAFADAQIEKDLHQQIFNECRRRGWIVFHGAMSERTHRTLGEPDFVILARNRIILVECKSRDGKLTPEQRAMAHGAASLGHTIHVVRSLAEFLEVAG